MLRECDFIAAEDTRVTMNLLNHFEIRKPLVSYYEHNKRQRGGEILSRLQAGESAVLVTDAGCPLFPIRGRNWWRSVMTRGYRSRLFPAPARWSLRWPLSGPACRALYL